MAGRPKRVFTDEDEALIEQYARNNSKSETIASALGIPVRSLKRHYARKMTQWRALGKVLLKDVQRKMADTSPQMAIWLGKQDLEQVDKKIITTEQVDSKPKSDQQLAAAKAAARAHNEVMSKTPNVIKISDQEAV